MLIILLSTLELVIQSPHVNRLQIKGKNSVILMNQYIDQKKFVDKSA
jgi:hypothetical protein